jgi:hypothetical protein
MTLRIPSPCLPDEVMDGEASMGLQRGAADTGPVTGFHLLRVALQRGRSDGAADTRRSGSSARRSKRRFSGPQR